MKKLMIALLIVVSGGLWAMEVDEPQAPQALWIETGDGVVIEVPDLLIQRSETLKHMLEDVGGSTTKDEPLPLPNIDSKTFNILHSFDLKTALSSLSLTDLIALANLVNYLDIADLLKIALEQLGQQASSLGNWNEILDNLQGDLIQSLWKNSEAYQWINTKALERPLHEFQDVTEPVLSPDGNYMISGSFDEGTIKIWDVNNNFELVNELRHTDVDRAIFSPDGKYMASQSRLDIGTIKIWNVNDNFKLVNELEFMSNRSVVFSPDGKYMIAWPYPPGTIKICNVKFDFGKVNQLKHSDVHGAIFSPDGKYMISWSYTRTIWSSGTIKIWDVDAYFDELKELHAHVDEVIFSPDGKYMVVRSFGGIKIWDVNKGFEQIHKSKDIGVDGVIFSPDGKYMFLWSPDIGTIKIWDVNAHFEQVKELQHAHVDGAIFSPDGKYMISDSFDEGTIKIWNVKANFKQVNELQHTEISGAIFSSDGNYMISLPFPYSLVWIIKIWDVNNNFDLVGKLQVINVIFTPNGRYMIAWDFEKTKIWDWDLVIMTLHNITSQHMKLLLHIYYTRDSEKQLQLSDDPYQIYRALSPAMQNFVRRIAPQYQDFFITIESSD